MSEEPKEFFAWVVPGHGGKSGFIAMPDPPGSPARGWPALSTTRHAMDHLRPMAERTAKRMGRPSKLCRYVLAEVIEEIAP